MMRKICRGLPNKKARESDMMPYEIVKNAGKDMKESTKLIINEVWGEEENPKSWNLSHIMMIYKGK